MNIVCFPATERPFILLSLVFSNKNNYCKHTLRVVNQIVKENYLFGNIIQFLGKMIRKFKQK